MLRMTFRAAIVVVVAVLTVEAVPAGAQVTGSAIVGVVKDQTGGVLPGVTVEVRSPALIERVKTVVTDTAGEYRVIDLRPGTYTITFRLEGFQAATHDGVEIRAAFTATINETLTTQTLEEAITVTGESPVVDLRGSGSERALNNQLIEGVPTARGIFALAAMVPGTAVNKPDVGGSQTHQLQSISIHGSSTQDVTWNVDGLNITASNGSGGLTATYFNQGLQEDVSIQTKAFPAEIGAGGVSINMITKSGGNTFRSQTFFSFANDSMQSKNVSDAQKASGFTAPAGVKLLADFNPEFGGPLKRDRLWFYSSFRYWRNNRTVAQTFNTDGTQALDEQLLMFFSGTVTGRLNDKNRLSGYVDWNKKQRDHRRDLTSTYQFIAPEASYWQRQGGPTANAKWTSTLSNSLMVEAGFSLDRILWHLYDQPGIADGAIAKNDLVLSTLTGAADKELTYDYPSRRNVAVAVSWFPNYLGSHNLRTGLQFAQLPYSTGYDDYGHFDMIARYRNGVPDSVLVWNTPTNVDVTMWDTAAFLQDSWNMKRLTLNGGLRYEHFTGRVNAQTAAAGTWVGARSFPEIPGPSWNSVVPRLAVVYDLFGTGKTALKVSASKYMQQQAAGLLNNFNPMRLLSEVRTWRDLNGDGIPQPAEVGADLGGLTRGANATMDPGLQWPYQWEYTASVEHELFKNTGVTVNYYHRRYSQLLALQNRAVGLADYTPIAVVNPYTGAPMTIYGQNASTIGQFNNVLTNSDAMYAKYDAFEVTFDRRFTRNLSVFGGLTLGANKGCYSGSTNPNDRINSCGYDPLDSTTIGNLSLLYKLPADVSFSTHFQHVTGQPLTLTSTFTKANVPGLNQVNQLVNLTAPGDVRKPNQNLWDIRLSKVLKTSTTLRLEPIFDLYNILNENAAVNQVTTVGPALGRVSENVDGRLVRIGVRVTF